MELKNNFSYIKANYLLKNNTYNYYRLGVWLDSSRSIKCFTKFINNLEQYSTDLFFSVFVNYITSNHTIIQNFLDSYFDKRFEGEAIEFSNWKSIINDISFLSNLNWEMFSNDKLICKRCHVVSFIPQVFSHRIASAQNEINWDLNILRDLSFHTLEVTFNQISKIIEHFDQSDLNGQNIPINSESCIKISVQSCTGTSNECIINSQ